MLSTRPKKYEINESTSSFNKCYLLNDFLIKTVVSGYYTYRSIEKIQLTLSLPLLLLATKQSQSENLGRQNLSVWFLVAFQSPKASHRVTEAYLQDLTASQVM